MSHPENPPRSILASEFGHTDQIKCPSGQVQTDVHQCLATFSSSVKDVLADSSNGGRLHSDWTKLCSQFLKAINHMRPYCVIDTPKVIHIDESEERSIGRRIRYPQGVKKLSCKDLGVNSRPTRWRFRGSPPTPCGGTREQVSVTPLAITNLDSHDFGPFSRQVLDQGLRVLEIDDIKAAKGRAGVPDHVSTETLKMFVSRVIITWQSPLETFISSTFELLSERILSCLSTALSKYRQTAWYNECVVRIKEFLKRQEDAERIESRSLLDIEEKGMFTINYEEFNRCRTKELAILVAGHREMRIAFLTKMCQANGNLKLEKSVTDEQIGPIRDQKELEAMADIRAYCEVAGKRFTDMVCQRTYNIFSISSHAIDYLLDRDLASMEGPMTPR